MSVYAQTTNGRAARPAPLSPIETRSGAPGSAPRRGNLVTEIIRAREEEHRSVPNLAGMAGVTPASIRKLEKGRGPVATLVGVLEALPFHVTGLAPGRTFAEQLRNRRTKMGMSLEAVALKAALPQTAVAQLEDRGGTVEDLLRLLAVIAPKARRRAKERVFWAADDKFERDSRFTPDSFMQTIYDSFGPVDVDPCGHVLSPVEARRRFLLAEGDDGLTDDWSGGVAFVNPPFSAKLPWLRRAHSQWEAGNVGTVLVLMPASVDSSFFHRTVRAVADVFILEGRLKFADETGRTQPTPHALMLVAFGATARQRALFEALVPGFWILSRGEAGVVAADATGEQPAAPHWEPMASPIAYRWIDCPPPRLRSWPLRVICGPSGPSAEAQQR